MPLLPLALIAATYLIGSIPFSYLIVRLLRKGDLRDHGSGNVGATNVVRRAGRLPGLIALLLDLGKGWAAAALAMWVVTLPQWPWAYAGEPSPVIESPAFWIGLASLVAVLGHMFPVWIHFRGGKGVATATGAFLALFPLVIVMAAMIFFIVVIATRYVSLGSMVAAASVPLLVRFTTDSSFWMVVFSILISLAVILKHRSNIARLAAGSERKFPR